MGIVSEHHVGADKDIVLYSNQFQKAIAMNAYIVADAIAELQNRIGANTYPLTDAIVFADGNSLAGL
jgi:hypothetical protein